MGVFFLENFLLKKKIKMNKIRIGFQGDIGSNSEEAAKQFVNKSGLVNADFIPLISSKNVIMHLKTDLIDYGVVAVRNSTAGIVYETLVALKGESFLEVLKVTVPVHHCLFKKHGVDISKIDTVVSHVQALKQTKENRQKYFPNLLELESEDTALAAIKLSNGEYPENYSLICRKNAGEQNGLELVMENLEDKIGNCTEFSVLKR